MPIETAFLQRMAIIVRAVEGAEITLEPDGLYLRIRRVAINGRLASVVKILSFTQLDQASSAVTLMEWTLLRATEEIEAVINDMRSP